MMVEWIVADRMPPFSKIIAIWIVSRDNSTFLIDAVERGSMFQ